MTATAYAPATTSNAGFSNADRPSTAAADMRSVHGSDSTRANLPAVGQVPIPLRLVGAPSASPQPCPPVTSAQWQPQTDLPLMWVQADPHAIIRRRQFVACVVLTIAVLLGAHLGGLSITSFPSVGSLDAGVTQAALPTVHVVAVGDSYGSIAAGLQQQAPLLTAEALRDLNGGAQLIPGQRLVLDLTSFG